MICKYISQYMLKPLLRSSICYHFFSICTLNQACRNFHIKMTEYGIINKFLASYTNSVITCVKLSTSVTNPASVCPLVSLLYGEIDPASYCIYSVSYVIFSDCNLGNYLVLLRLTKHLGIAVIFRITLICRTWPSCRNTRIYFANHFLTRRNLLWILVK